MSNENETKENLELLGIYMGVEIFVLRPEFADDGDEWEAAKGGIIRLMTLGASLEIAPPHGAFQDCQGKAQP